VGAAGSEEQPQTAASRPTATKEDTVVDDIFLFLQIEVGAGSGAVFKAVELFYSGWPACSCRRTFDDVGGGRPVFEQFRSPDPAL
jgi:hypothetical protein